MYDRVQEVLQALLISCFCAAAVLMKKHDKQVFKTTHYSTVRIIMLTFLAVIMLGTMLLMLPFSTASGEWCPLLTALFTAATSVCVTGLVVVETASYWSFFGKIVIVTFEETLEGAREF